MPRQWPAPGGRIASFRQTFDVELSPQTCHTIGMIKFSIAMAGVFSAALFLHAEDYTIHTFKKIKLTDQFWSEGANFGDFNHDGKKDVVAGPYWWEGPDFRIRHEYYPANKSFKLKKPDGTEETIPGFEGALGKNNVYSDNFFAFTYD